MDARDGSLRSAPGALDGGNRHISELLQQNPFYVDPDQLIIELREHKSRVGAGTAV